MIDDDYEKIKREIVFEKAAKAIKEDPDGFDALYELSKKYGPESDKGKIVQEILRRQESEPDSIDL
jgi:hypothetical protein